MEILLTHPISEKDAVGTAEIRQAMEQGKEELSNFTRACNFLVFKGNAVKVCKALKLSLAMWTLAVAYFYAGAREACETSKPLLEAVPFNEELRSSSNFDDWGSRALKRSESFGYLTRFRYIGIDDLGPTYSKEYRNCIDLHSKVKCGHLASRLHVIQPAGFTKAVMLAHLQKNEKLQGELACTLRRVPQMLKGLGIKYAKNKKEISSIDRDAQSDSYTGKRYHFKRGEKILLPLIADCVNKEVPFHVSCVPAYVGDHGAILWILGAVCFLYRLYKSKFQVWIREDQILEELAKDNADIFSATTENVMDRIRLDIGLSLKFGVLFRDGPNMLSQNWLFCAGEGGFSGCLVCIMTLEEKVKRETLCKLISPSVREKFETRLNNPTWKYLQVLRQLNVDLYQCTKEGGFLSISPLLCFPQKPTERQSRSLRECIGEHFESSQEADLTRSISESSVDSIWRKMSDRLTGERRPLCAVTYEKQLLFVINGKQIYSWDALYQHVLQKGGQQSDEFVVYEDEGQCYKAYLQSDMVKQPLNKSNDFDFHCDANAPQIQMLGMDELAGLVRIMLSHQH